MPGGYIFGWDNTNNVWKKLKVDANGRILIDTSNLLDDTPVNGETSKGITSNWAYDHKNAADAHHAKYTDAEAKTACKLDGTLYLSISGIAFDAQHPHLNDIYKSPTGYVRADVDWVVFVTPVNLPDGVKVTGVIVYGNDAATAEICNLRRVSLNSDSFDDMTGAYINTEDTTVSNDIIDNSTYSYFIRTTSLDIDDIIYGARISYTL